MRPYRDRSGDSGIVAYEYDDRGESIRIQFIHGGAYEYRASEIGARHLATMKRLADAGDGLNTYINQHPEVKNGYSNHW